MRICQRRKSLELSLGLQNCLSDFKRGRSFYLEALSRTVKEHSVVWKQKQHHLFGVAYGLKS